MQGVRCQRAECGHRALLSLECLDARSGNMKRLIDLKLGCSQCTARVFDMYLFPRADDAEAFMRGDDVEQSEDF